MKKTDFTKDWYYRRWDEAAPGKPISLPHDAMCAERRTLSSRGRHNIGWFESFDYVYTKHFSIAEQEKEKTVILEFEGIYHNAEIYVNGKRAAFRAYGYTDFYVDITPYLEIGRDNELKVIARNADQPNSRWYTGSGIYRPVWMYTGGVCHIKPSGLKIHTAECDKNSHTAVLHIEAAVTGKGDGMIRIYDPDGALKAEQKVSGEELLCTEIKLSDVRLWNLDTPVLYTCVMQFEGDEETVSFGIRTVSWDAEKGIAVNGEHVILKGACIHHDNGVLGACAFPEAEERKIRILKETGYNAIRSAHNPCSKAMLEACDRLGMFVMDEYVDMWYIHKNEYDYAADMRKWWKQDLLEMVEKDYNHPSVLLYSTGNEVAETGQKEGIELTGQMTEYLHGLDGTRPVTCGINIFFNFLYSMGFGVYSDDKAKKEARESESGKKKKKKTVGSEFYNTLAGLLGDKTMKIGATLHMCDVKTRDAYANMDVAGYNYGIFRYKHDLKKYPNRLILGSETFCKDAYDFYELAKKEPRIVGDFVWAGMDYMGEAGIGSWEYSDYAPMETENPGWLTAGSGRINILGFPLGEAAYTSVALEQEKGPRIAVRPVYQKGRHTPSAWKMTDAMESWSWRGCEGQKAVVEVYARAAKVELYVNGKLAQTKRFQKGCNVEFTVPYENGTLEAVSYDVDGNRIAATALQTAGEDTRLSLFPETDSIKKDGLGYIRLRYTDSKGIWKPMEKHHIRIQVENGTLMGFGNACPFNEDGYWKDATKTYYGEALAVVRADGEEPVHIRVSDETKEYHLDIPVVCKAEA